MSLKVNLIDKKKETSYAVKSSDGMVIKDVDIPKRIVTGFYNTAMYYDSDNDVLLKGCADNSIKARGPKSTSGAQIKHLMFHDWTKLPGKILVLEERTIDIEGKNVTGIYFETSMSPTQLGNDALINYQEKVYDNHSIGFRYLDGTYIDNEEEDWSKYLSLLINPEDAEKHGYMFLWKEIHLFEGSTVGIGANELTPFLGVKSGNKESLLLKMNERYDILTKQLKVGTQSDEMLQSFEMQVLQLKQLSAELFATGPTIKDTLQEQGRLNKDTQTKEVNWDKIAAHFQ